MSRALLDLILAAESGELADDDEVLAAADAIWATRLHLSVGWAGRFLRDVHEAFGWEPSTNTTTTEGTN